MEGDSLMSDFTAFLDWFFQALLMAADAWSSVWILSLFLSLGILCLVFKIYSLLS